MKVAFRNTHEHSLGATARGTVTLTAQHSNLHGAWLGLLCNPGLSYKVNVISQVLHIRCTNALFSDFPCNYCVSTKSSLEPPPPLGNTFLGSHLEEKMFQCPIADFSANLGYLELSLSLSLWCVVSIS